MIDPSGRIIPVNHPVPGYPLTVTGTVLGTDREVTGFLWATIGRRSDLKSLLCWVGLGNDGKWFEVVVTADKLREHCVQLQALLIMPNLTEAVRLRVSLDLKQAKILLGLMIHG